MILAQINTAKQLAILQQETYIWAAVIIIAAWLISLLIAQVTPFKPRWDTSYISRRIWSIVLCLVSVLGYLIYNFTVVMPDIRRIQLKDDFSTTVWICFAAMIVIYAVTGWIVSMVFPRSKYATVFRKHSK